MGNNKELKEEQHNIAVQPFALWFLTSFEIAESHKVHGNASGGGDEDRPDSNTSRTARW